MTKNSSVSDSNITTSGSSGYGIYLASSSTNTLSNNNITTSSSSGYGFYLSSSSNSNITGNIMNTTNAYAVYVSPSTTASYYNHTIDTTNTEQGKPIYYYFANSSITIENLYDIGQLYVTNSTNITIRNITVLNKDGIILAMTKNSSVSDSNITTSGSSGYGIYLYSSSTNNITGGSIISKLSYDYYLQSAGITNNFTNTNFTAARRIYFADITSWFNYNNNTGNIWLKTNVSVALMEITRTLVNWNNTLMKWNDTNISGIFYANYSLTGLQASTQYQVQNTSRHGGITVPYNLTTNTDGVLPSFNINLSGNTEIAVFSISIDTAPPTYSLNSTSSTIA